MHSTSFLSLFLSHPLSLHTTPFASFFLLLSSIPCSLSFYILYFPFFLSFLICSGTFPSIVFLYVSIFPSQLPQQHLSTLHSLFFLLSSTLLPTSPTIYFWKSRKPLQHSLFTPSFRPICGLPLNLTPLKLNLTILFTKQSSSILPMCPNPLNTHSSAQPANSYNTNSLHFLARSICVTLHTFLRHLIFITFYLLCYFHTPCFSSI